MPDSSLYEVSYHSRYSPLKEAQRHVDALLSGKRPAIVFIIGGGINYISAVIAERFPNAVRVSLQPCDDFLGHEVDTPTRNWHPSSILSLRETIRQALASNRIAGGVMIVEWPPVVNRFQELTEKIRIVLRDILEEASSNAATTGYWAARWLHNSMRFVTSASSTAGLTPGASLVVIACAGPSLASVIPEILDRRSSMALWALASAIPALQRFGLIPDLAIATDPGFWNGAHLRAAFFSKIPIAMPPSSYAPCDIMRHSRIVTLDTGLSFEKAAIQAAGISSEGAIASGSVAGTALSLALRLTNGPIALAGYDLAAQGLMDHIQPYAFDILDEKAENRLQSTYSTRASRVFEGYPSKEGEWRRSRAFTAYAGTIQVHENDSPRVFRLGESSVETCIRRAQFVDIPSGSNIAPRCIPDSLQKCITRAERDEAVRTMLKNLAEAASEQALDAIKNLEPLPYDAALYYKALAPRESAALIAEAARGEAKVDDIAMARIAARKAAASWLGARSC